MASIPFVSELLRMMLIVGAAPKQIAEVVRAANGIDNDYETPDSGGDSDNVAVDDNDGD